MAWNSFTYVENQGEITGKSFREQTEQAINDVAFYAGSVVDIQIGDAVDKAVAEATAKATEELKKTAVLTEPQALSEDKKLQARTNINALDGAYYASTLRAGLVKPDGSTITVTEDGTITAVGGGGGGSVFSVNGKQGIVTLSADDVGAVSASGGSVRGALRFETSYAIKRDISDSSLAFYGGSGTSSTYGAFLELFGASHRTYGGAFHVSSGNGWQSKELWLYPDGRALWNNKNFLFEGDAIAKIGERGAPAGKVRADIQTLYSSTRECTDADTDTTFFQTSGAITLNFKPSALSTGAVKQYVLKADSTTTLSLRGATWANNSTPPKWGSTGGVLILVASFTFGAVYVGVMHNSEAL